MDNSLLNEIKLLLAARQSPIAFLATLDAAGHPRVRPVILMVTPRGFYIATSRKSRKAAEIRENNSVEWVTLLSGESGTGYLRLAGSTREIEGREKRSTIEENDYPVDKYWSGVDDPDFVVFRMEPQRVEYIRPGEDAAMDVTRVFAN